MKKAILLYFLFCVQIIFCQNNSIENLNSELKIATSDTVKIKILRKLGYTILESDPKGALAYFKEMFTLAQRTNLPKKLGSAYTALGVAYQKLTLYDEALKCDLEALTIAESLKLNSNIAVCCQNIGANYVEMSNLPKALEYLLRGLKVAEEINNKKLQAGLYLNISVVYLNSKNYDLTVLNNSKAFELYKQVGDSVNMANALDNIAMVQYDYSHFSESLNNVLRSLKIKESLKDTIGVAWCYDIIAKAYLVKKDWNTAIRYYNKALKIYLSSQNAESASYDYLFIGSAYLESGDYPRALEYLNLGFPLAVKASSAQQIVFSYEHYAKLYSRTNNYKKAYEYQKLLFTTYDSINNSEKNKQIVEMQTKYETTKKEEEITKLTQQSQILTQQNQIQQLEISRNWYLILGLGSFLLLILIVAFLLAQQNKLKANQTKMEVEQKLFRSQMNPHFIFNSLIAIQNYVYKHEPAEVAKYISSFAKLMRMILENSRNEYVTIEKELDTLKYYLELQQLRFQDKFDFSIEVDPNIDVEAVSIPPMLSQPFIENAIEHGIMNKQDGKGNIVLKFIQKDKMIEMIVEDNGIGIENATKLKAQHDKKHTSLATTITEERLAILNKRSKLKFSLKIADLKNEKGLSRGTQVCITMPEA